MCLIAGSVVIDQFTLRLDNLIYILTHWHSDHYQGIYNGWNHGPIYASKITRQLLLTKYPKLIDRVHILPKNQWICICQISGIKAFAFDSNHMAGSIMVLLNIDGKYYLHTGDMRFNPKIAQKTPQVFNKKEQSYMIKYDIEELHLDNTFCDPIFKFPTRSKALRMIIDLLKQTQPKRLFLCTDSVGKQEAFILLSRYFNIRIAVSENRMNYLKAIDINQQSFFTLDTEETWIQVISKSEKEKKICEASRSIAITLTGWANLSHPYPDGQRSYLVPYSLHSNFKQIECLVSLVRPKKLIGVVREDSGKWQKLSKSSTNYKGYMFSLMGVKQRGMEYLREEYCRKETKQSQKENVIQNKAQIQKIMNNI